MVRKLVGYGRPEGATATPALAELHEVARLYVSFFSALVQAEIEKTRGRKGDEEVSCVGDALRALIERRPRDGRMQNTNAPDVLVIRPGAIVESDSHGPTKPRAKRKWGSASEGAVEINRDLNQFVQSMYTAWHDGEVRATHRKPITGTRSWRTRADPFETALPLVQEWLNEQPDMNAKSIFNPFKKR